MSHSANHLPKGRVPSRQKWFIWRTVVIQTENTDLIQTGNPLSILGIGSKTSSLPPSFHLH